MHFMVTTKQNHIYKKVKKKRKRNITKESSMYVKREQDWKKMKKQKL